MSIDIKYVWCVVRVSATGSGTTPINYRILAAYGTELEASEAAEALPETPRVRHYVDKIVFNPTKRGV